LINLKGGKFLSKTQICAAKTYAAHFNNESVRSILDQINCHIIAGMY
jgi:hypothetical protein